jgi:hypothetical protein
MKRLSILSVCITALLSSSSFAQDIILLNQDGEKVGVAKDVDEKKIVREKAVVKPVDDANKEPAKIENGVVTFVGPDGKVQTFKMSDAKSVTITRSSNTVVGEDGQRKVERRGKAILIGPDGVRREIDLGAGGLGESVTESKAPKTWMIGVSCQPASPVLRSQLQLDDDIGLVVTRVLQGGAGEKAGLKSNDVLMFADQKPLGNRKQLSVVVNEAGAAGDDVTFTLLRAGEEISLAVAPTEREGMSQMMIELGPGMRGFELGLPGFEPGAEFEFRQLGPGIILDRGLGGDLKGLHEELIGDMEEKMQRIQKQVEEMQQRMHGDRQ